MIIISSASTFYLRVPFKLIHLLRFSYSNCEVRTINNSSKLNTELHCYGAKVNPRPKEFLTEPVGSTGDSRAKKTEIRMQVPF